MKRKQLKYEKIMIKHYRIDRQNILLLVLTIIAIAVLMILLSSCSNVPTTIFDKNSQSVVELKCVTESVGESYGSAVVWDSNGMLITNAHVVTYTRLGEANEFETYQIRFSYEEDYRNVSLLRYDSELDLAVLKIDDLTGLKLKPVEKGNSDTIDYCDKVYAIGNASNYGLSITQGIISMPIVNIEYDNVTRKVIQCDLTISGGNSGGALLDEKGKLIGITTFRTKDNSGNIIYGLAYCIPINIAKSFIESV